MAKRPQLIFLCLVTALVVVSAKPMIAGADSLARFAALHAMMTGEELTPLIEKKFSASQGLLALPLYAFGLATAPAAPPEARIKHLKATVAHFNHLLLIGFTVWLLGWFRRRLGFDHATAAASSLIVLLVSMLLPHGRDFYSEILWTITAFYALDQLVGQLATPVWPDTKLWKLAAASAAITWFSTILTVPWVIVVATFWGVALSQRIPARQVHLVAVWAALGTCLGIGLIAVENFLERGHALTTGYGSEPFAWAPMQIAMLLASPGKGILWFAPTLLVLPWARQALSGYRAFAQGILLSVVLLLVYGSWWAWDGAGYWGPRFMLFPSVVAAVAGAIIVHGVSRRLRTAAWLSLAVAAVSTKIGLSVGQRYYDDCALVPEPCAVSFVLSPFYAFAKGADGWHEVVWHQSTVVYVLGLTALWCYLKRSRADTL